MTSSQVTPYGAWKSPITSDLIVAGSIGLGQIQLDGQDIYWGESRPTEGGRNVIVRRTPTGEITDMTPAPFNARTRVHEYGGGAFSVVDRVIYFSNFSDQRLYRQAIPPELNEALTAEAPLPITPEQAFRYADVIVDAFREQLICIREDHTVADREAINTIISVPLDGREQTVLISGSDFYAFPRLSPDGSMLAWISWNHPHMPWDETELWVGQVQADGSITEVQKIAGDHESIFQPQWSPDGRLYFVSDRTNWWNLYRWNPMDGKIEALCPKEAEFGLPLWVFGMSTYGFANRDRLICTYTQNGMSQLASLDLNRLELSDLSTPYTSIAGLHVNAEQAVFVGGSPTEPSAIVRFDLSTAQCEVLRRASELKIDSGYLSIPEAIEFPTENGLTAHALYYAPKNQDYTAPEDERPPMLVKSHGGPTAATSASLSLSIQYWTSRGFAFLDVNYGGSTGYGRAYRERLKRQWGIVDVDDCANGAKYLAEQGKVDGDRLVITGGSAGGYTTLCALTFRDTFKAGASHYGVSDLKALAEDTHKFESRYLDGLIGVYPDEKELYDQRSPISAVDRLSCPVIFFQGDEDKIVPPNQAEMMVNALRDKGLPVAYVLFEGEQHGFRKAENIKRALDGEFYFYSRVFGYQTAEEINPVAIANL